MEIERVNDSTIRFFITYKDIEERGFNRDEIWYNRERGEELFFEMINEAHNNDEEFAIEGPLWIQVQALEKGLEIVVTRGQISGGNVKLEIPMTSSKGFHHDENVMEMFDGHLDEDDIDEDHDEQIEIIIGFEDFEDVITLSHSFDTISLENHLYHLEGRYYLHVLFNDEQYDENEQDDLLSRMLEFGYESDITIYLMEEYGKKIIAGNAMKTIREHFTKA